MTSIRVFLVVALLATMTLTVFLSALHGYRASMAEAQTLFDTKLADAAQLLAATHVSDSPGDGRHDTARQFAYQVWQGGKLRQQSTNAPSSPMARLEAGYEYNNFNRYRWRTYVLPDPQTQRWIITAERSDVRNELAEHVIHKSVVPVVVALPLAGLLIWFVVGYGLAPLRRLAAHLRDKRADDLGPLPRDDQPRELMQVVTSINDLLRRLDASFRREKQFAADAAHELRTPLSAMKIHLHNIANDLAEDNHNLQQLESATSRMQNVVEQILALYSTAPDEILVHFEPVDLHALAQECITRRYSRFAARHQELELDGRQACVAGDRFALETLLQNLLDNACKYTPTGSTVRVSVREQESRVILQVQDSGPGIPADQRDRVFDRFYRLGGDQHASGVIGCGLGLSIVRHVAELHHATISLGESEFASGLSVSVSFPACGGQARRHLQAHPGGASPSCA
ncbi:MAG: HAMP domain-containing sensor histidine kinase [Gammaproteobacteria bacterium]